MDWPEELAERYRREGYWRGEVLGDVLRRWAREDVDRTALVTPSGRHGYAEIDARADRLAAGLRRLGLGPRDRVVVQLPNVPEFIVVSVALFRLGAIPVFALPSHRRSEITYLCEHAEAAAYVIPAAHQGFDYCALARDIFGRVPSLQHVLVAGDPGEFVSLEDVDDDVEPLPLPSPGDVAFFLLSGGTTGRQKLIPRTHDDYAYQLRATAEALGIGEHSVYLAALPAAHNAALGCPGVLGTLLAGGKVVLPASPSPDDAFPLVASEGVTLTTLVPSLLMLWMEDVAFSKADLSKLLLQVGGAKLSPDVARKVLKERYALTHWFGMAEGLLSFTRLDDPEDVIVLTQGRPLSPADELRVVDELDRDVERGQVGQLLTRGPYTLRGYYKVPQHNAVTFTHDGFLRTGDLVRITPAGDMIVEGRIKDIIIRGGEKIPAEELEDHLMTYPGVRGAAVVAMPDLMMGEKTCAFVIASGGAVLLGDVKAFLRGRGLADYKLPDRLEVVESFPLTSLGKVNKVVLREMIAQKLLAGREAR